MGASLPCVETNSILRAQQFDSGAVELAERADLH